MDFIFIILLFVVSIFINSEIESPLKVAIGFTVTTILIVLFSSLMVGHPDYMGIIFDAVLIFPTSFAYYWLLKKLSGALWWGFLFGAPLISYWLMGQIYNLFFR